MNKIQEDKIFGTLVTAIVLLVITVFGLENAGYVKTAIEPKACESTEETITECTVEPSSEPTTETPSNEIPTKQYYDCPLSDDLQEFISEQCEVNNLPMPLVLAVIEVESNFKADVISSTNDYGLMQINKVNHRGFTDTYGITDFLDPYLNVLCGITLLAEPYARYGDIDKALMAYNLGDSGAKRLWNSGIYQTAYTEDVRTAMEAYEGVG